jgi:xylulokinase
MTAARAKTVFLGLDVGTSGVKAVLVDVRGKVRGAATGPLGVQAPQPGWAEQRPDDWWRAARLAIKGALRKAKARAADVAAVGLSGQMHSSVFLDGKSAPIRPALLWCDGRTTAECREITERLGEGRLKEWVRNPALEGFTLPKVLWLRKHEPDAFARLSKVVLPKDYVRLKLTGVLATDPSDASATLMYDVAGGRWCVPLMQELGLDPGLLPEVIPSAGIAGRVTAAAAKATGLAEGTPVVTGGADNACGAIGVGVVTPGEVVASWGTSGTVLAPFAEPVGDPQLRAHTFCHAVPGTFYVMGVMLTAGGAFAWYRRELAQGGGGGNGNARKSGDGPGLDAEAASVAPGAEGVTFLPYLQGERTPHRDASARGALVGLSLAHGRAHVTRAVLEGICFGLRDSLEIVRSLGLDVREVLVTGGGAASRFVRRLQADVYGLPVVPVDAAEGPAVGAALLAAVGAGAFPDVVTACRRTVKRKPAEKPDEARHRAYEIPYARFRALYPALRALATP